MSFTVCLSHDVDRTKKTFQYITHGFKSLIKGNFRMSFYHLYSLFLKNPYWQFDKIINIENKFGVKSTFFFLNESYPFKFLKIKTWSLSVGYYNINSIKLQNIIKFLDANGWEIGVHGSYLSFNRIDLLNKEKKAIENILGHNVSGIRQHFLNLNKETWHIQKEAGFKYDSTFGFRDYPGFKNDRYHLFTPDNMTDFYVVPMALMDMNIMHKEDPWNEALKMINIAEEKEACLVVNWHQRVFNKKEFPAYSQIYYKIIEECKSRNAEFLTIKNYINKKLYT